MTFEEIHETFRRRIHRYLARLVGPADAEAELVAIGAAIAANCEPCFKYHYDQARKLGVSPGDMARAVALAQSVKETPARAVLALAERYLGRPIAPAETAAKPSAAGACCAPSRPAGKCC
jgi:AhpD family alkylhydroperoxidase